MATLVLGLGYLGAALARDLLAGGEAVVGLDNGFATDWPAVEGLGADLPGRFTLLRGDLRDASALEEAFRAAAPVRTVFLLAAQASAHPQAAPPEYTEETNLRGPRLVFEGALRHGRPPVVYGSSFHVYGPGLQGEVDERRPYGALRDLAHLSKVYAEKLGEMMALTEGVPCSPVRLGIVYGLGPVTKSDLRFVTAPHAFCLRAIAGEPLPIHPAGLHPAGYVHLADAVAALRLAAGLPRPGDGPTSRPTPCRRPRPRWTWPAWCSARPGRRGTTPRCAGTRPEAPAGEEDTTGTAGGQAFTVRSVLDGAGWRPTGTLAAALPQIFAHYAAGLPGNERRAGRGRAHERSRAGVPAHPAQGPPSAAAAGRPSGPAGAGRDGAVHPRGGRDRRRLAGDPQRAHRRGSRSRTRLRGSWRGRCGRWTGSCSGSAATPPWTAS